MSIRALSLFSMWSILLIALGAAPVSAQSFVNVTGCDSVSINGQTYGRLTYSIHNLHPQLVMLQYIMHPVSYEVPADTCHVLQATAPSGWGATIQGNGGVDWYSGGPATDIPPGGTLDGFQIVQSGATCCFLFIFSSSFDEPFASERVCFRCDLATPAKGSSWGRLKQQYR